MDQSGEFHWLETYFIYFPSKRRPKLEKLESVIRGLNPGQQISMQSGDDEGRFESLTITVPDDRIAIEISYEQGESVSDQAIELAAQLGSEAEPQQLEQLFSATARLDIMHFELVEGDAVIEDDGEEPDFDDMFDPGVLLLTVDALVELTGGVPIDSSSGSVLP